MIKSSSSASNFRTLLAGIGLNFPFDLTERSLGVWGDAIVKTDIKINEEMDSSRDDTNPYVKEFIEREFGFSSTDVQGWIEDTLDSYWMEFRIKIERNDTLMCCISIELFYSNPAAFPFGTITKENHPVSQDQIDFLKERLSEYGFNLRFSEDVYYPATCTYLAFRFKKTNI